MRQRLYAEMTVGFVAGLSVTLRRLLRRPKAPHTLSEIAVAVGATSDGFLLLHKMQPELFDARSVVDTQRNVIWGLSEPGLPDWPSQNNPQERDLVEAALQVYATGSFPR